MDAVIIQPENESELNLIEEFIKNNNLKSKTLSEEDKEDMILLNMMEKTDYNETIETNEFLKSLRQ